MAGTSLNDIYRSLGTLTQAVKGLEEKIDDNERRNSASIRKADASRANVHKRLDDVILRTTHLESDVGSVKAKVEDMQRVTDDVVSLRQKAEGAGTLGRWLLRVGAVILSAASGAAGAWYAMTGRPPP